MPHIALTALVVKDYDPAIDFYVTKLGFNLVEDTDLGGGKRWVVVVWQLVLLKAFATNVGR